MHACIPTVDHLSIEVLRLSSSSFRASSVQLLKITHQPLISIEVFPLLTLYFHLETAIEESEQGLRVPIAALGDLPRSRFMVATSLGSEPELMAGERALLDLK